MKFFDRATVADTCIYVEGTLAIEPKGQIGAIKTEARILTAPSVIIVDFRDGLILGETVYVDGKALMDGASGDGTVESLTRSFAIALAPREVRVNCVAPGYLSAPMRGEGAELRARQGGNDELKKFTPFGRLVTPHEVAEVVAFLCSARASGISGVVLPVDGGQRAY